MAGTSNMAGTSSDDPSLTNGSILELWAKDDPVMRKDIAQDLNVRLDSLSSAIKRLQSTYKKLTKRRCLTEEKRKFLDKIFLIPQKQIRKPKEAICNADTECGNCTKLLEVNEEEKKRYTSTVEDLQKKLDEAERARKKDATSARTKVREVRKLSAGSGRIERRLVRLKSSCSHWKTKFLDLKSTNALCEQKLERAEKRARHYCRRFKALQKSTDSSRSKSQAKIKCVPDKDFLQLTNTVVDLQTQLAEMQSKSPTRIPTKEGRIFNPKIREVSYSLQNLGVAEKNVSEAIKVVSETLHDKQVGPLPSQTTQARLSAEMKALSRVQVREAVTEHQQLTLKYDGTTKGRLGHLAEIEVSTSSQTFLTGITQQVGGTAAEYVDSIERSCSSISGDLLGKITNTMTDRCVTNNAIDRKIEEIQGKKLNSFRCSMHPLDSFAREANKSLKKLDKEEEVDQPKKKMCLPFVRREQCSALALTHAASKLFHKESCGETQTLHIFLKEKGLKAMLPRYVGSRFNMFFHSSAILFTIGDHINDYFKTVQRPSNDLHRAFVNGWATYDLTHLRCLGIVDKLITGPWMLVIGKDPNILAMNTKFQAAKSTLERWKDDPNAMISEGRTVFGMEVADDVFTTLRSIPEQDLPNVSKVLSILSGAILDVVARQLASQLPGGEFWDPSPELLRSAESCTAHNISGERNFAVVDAALHKAPNISLGKIEAKTMFQVNKTKGWLGKKPDIEKARLIRAAVRDGGEERKLDKKRKVEYNDSLRKRVREKQHKLSQQEEKERDKTEVLLESIMENGLWKDRERITTKVNSMSKTKAKDVLKKQIQFKTKILAMDLGKHQISKSSVEELVNILLSNNNIPDNHIVKTLLNPSIMKGMELHHKWDDNGTVWYHGHIIDIKEEEYAIKYENNTELFYMTVSEFLTDLHVEDISLVDN